MLTVPPSTTFADLKRLQMRVEVTCQRCGNTQRLDGSWVRIAGRRIAGARYRCGYTSADGRTCGGIGLPTLKPELQRAISPGRMARARRNI